jgi:hypothetical protein
MQDTDLKPDNSGNYPFHEPDKQADLCLNTHKTTGSFFYVMAVHTPR